MEPLSVDEFTDNTTFSDEKFLVYPFVRGDKIELAAKDLSLCDFKGDYDSDALITLQLDHTAGKSHFLTFNELDRNTLKPRTWVNDTVVDFWFRWIARNEPFHNDVLTLTSHFYSTLRKKDGLQQVSQWMQSQKIDVFSKHLIMFPINIHNSHWSLCAICNLTNFSTIMKQGIKDNDMAIPFMMHLDSSGIHTTDEISYMVQSWLKHEFELRNGAWLKHEFELRNDAVHNVIDNRNQTLYGFICPLCSPRGNYN